MKTKKKFNQHSLAGIILAIEHSGKGERDAGAPFVIVSRTTLAVMDGWSNIRGPAANQKAMKKKKKEKRVETRATFFLFPYSLMSCCCCVETETERTRPVRRFSALTTFDNNGGREGMRISFVPTPGPLLFS